MKYFKVKMTQNELGQYTYPFAQEYIPKNPQENFIQKQERLSKLSRKVITHDPDETVARKYSFTYTDSSDVQWRVIVITDAEAIAKASILDHEDVVEIGNVAFNAIADNNVPDEEVITNEAAVKRLGIKATRGITFTKDDDNALDPNHARKGIGKRLGGKAIKDKLVAAE